jgi:hypothetical protein
MERRRASSSAFSLLSAATDLGCATGDARVSLHGVKRDRRGQAWSIARWTEPRPTRVDLSCTKRSAVQDRQTSGGLVHREEMDRGAPDTSRTCDQRFRKPLDNAAISRGYEAEGQLATVSRELHLAVAADDAETACALATALARGVLGSPVGALASAVLRGGPLAMTKAIALAERVLGAGRTPASGHVRPPCEQRRRS